MGETTARTAACAFPEPGTYSVSLTVTDEHGATDTVTKTVNVTESAPVTPVEAIAGPDRQPSLREIQEGIRLWATGQPVPDAGETLTIMEVQRLIQAWWNGQTIAG